MVEIKLTVCYTQETKVLQVVLCMDLFSYENNYQRCSSLSTEDYTDYVLQLTEN